MRKNVSPKRHDSFIISSQPEDQHRPRKRGTKKRSTAINVDRSEQYRRPDQHKAVLQAQTRFTYSSNQERGCQVKNRAANQNNNDDRGQARKSETDQTEKMFTFHASDISGHEIIVPGNRKASLA